MKLQLALSGLMIAFLPAVVSAQQAEQIAPAVEVPSVQTAPRAVPAVRGAQTLVRGLASTPTTAGFWQQTQSDMHNAISELKKSESDDDRKAAIENLRGVLEDQYDESLDNYEKYLASLEEQIKEMRSQIDKRRDAKMELVDLRLKMLVNEADGLGWPDERPGRFFSGQGFRNIYPTTSGFGSGATPFANPAAPAQTVRPRSSRSSRGSRGSR